jgi:hypothetical protein
MCQYDANERFYSLLYYFTFGLLFAYIYNQKRERLEDEMV